MKESSNKRHVLLIYLALGLATFIAFEQVRKCGFVYDDEWYISTNYPVRAGLTGESIVWAFTDFMGYWHPLPWLSHMLDCQVFGLNAAGHHLTSLLIHIANAGLLFWVLKKMTGDLWPSAFVAAVFALHPLRVESVAWVTERKDVLSAFFWMLTMAAYIRYARRPHVGRYLLVLLVFTLGLMAKPMLVTLPFVLLLLDYWPLGRLRKGDFRKAKAWPEPEVEGLNYQKASAYRLVLEKIPFLVLSVVLVCALVLSAYMLSAGFVPLKLRITNALVSYPRYISKILWPTNLAVFYTYPQTIPLWQSITAALLLVCVTILVSSVSRSKPYLCVGWLWFLGTLVPVLGLMQSGNWPAIADRFTYLPSVGISIMVAWSIAKLLPKWRYATIGIAISAAAVIITLLICTRMQVRYWKNNLTLYEHTLEVTEDNFLILNNYGAELGEIGKLDLALDNINEALKLNPNFASAIHNLGRILKEQGKLEQAVEQWKKVLQLDPHHAAANANIALAMIQQGRYARAIEHLNKSLQEKPDTANLYALGHIYRQLGKYEMAIQNYTEALRLDPDFVQAHFDLAVTYSQIGNHQMAIRHYREVLRIRPDYPGVLNNIGMELKAQGKINQAVETWKKALDINPAGYGVHFNIGLAVADQGNYHEAVEHYNKALLADPNWPQVLLNLAWAYAQLGRDGPAIGQYYRLLRLYPDRIDTLRRLAWILATTEDEKFLDPAEAISLAQKACNLTDYKEPLLLDTLAAAYAAAGQFSQAVTTAENALRLAESSQQTELAHKIKEHLRLYKANQRYIE